jgi:uroporphyrinogen III methyltransferase/synthase
MKLKIGTRKSALALRQVRETVKALTQKDPSLEFEIIGIDTMGDKDKEISLCGTEGTDFFTREIEAALLDGLIDIAVHSAKDLPEEIPAGLKIAAITEGVEPRDVLVFRKGLHTGRYKNIIEKLPAGAVVGTSSERRKTQILAVRPDVGISDIRGTVDDRLRQLDNGKYDALILAAAGLIRLGLRKRISGYLGFETAHLQGKLALEVRVDDMDSGRVASLIDGRGGWGRVFLVGAGPGDAELISVKGDRLLKSCDAVVYDSLSNIALIEGLDCKKIFVGKRKGSHYKEQDEINQTLVRLALEGKNTVRLKGGDPLIFGRGLEEADYLRKHFVKYEIVPGITAALAASAYAEIPLTKRGGSPYVTLSSGHHEENTFIPEAGYKGTAVYYMAASRVNAIAYRLLKNGMSESTPAAVVSNASLVNQITYAGTLGSFLTGKEYNSPAIFIVGASAVNRGKSWFDLKKKILFTGTNPDRYRDHGELLNNAMIELKSVVKKITVRDTGKYDAIVFTSKHGVKYFFEAFNRAGNDSRDLYGKKIYSVGSVTSAELAKYGIRPDIQAVFETAEGLVTEFRKRRIKGKKVMLPCSVLSYDTLRKGLASLGNKAVPFVVYKNILPRKAAKLDLTGIDSVIFTSPSCVNNFKKVYGGIPADKEIITTGKITKEAADNAKIQES